MLSDVKLREGVERVAFAESLTHVPQVIGALRLTGEYDYQLHIVCGDPTEFEGLVDRLKRDYGGGEPQLPAHPARGLGRQSQTPAGLFRS